MPMISQLSRYQIAFWDHPNPQPSIPHSYWDPNTQRTPLWLFKLSEFTEGCCHFHRRICFGYIILATKQHLAVSIFFLKNKMQTMAFLFEYWPSKNSFERKPTCNKICIMPSINRERPVSICILIWMFLLNHTCRNTYTYSSTSERFWEAINKSTE